MRNSRQIAVVAMLIVGIALVLLGATWKHWRSPETLWSKDQAAEYTDAWNSLKKIATSGKLAGDPSSNPKLAAAQSRFNAIKARLDQAIVLNDYTGVFLTAGGLIVIACASLFWHRAVNGS